MPSVRIEWFPGRSLEQKREMISVLTPEICRIADCRPETVQFVFVDVDRQNWGRNGALFHDEYFYDNEADES